MNKINFINFVDEDSKKTYAKVVRVLKIYGIYHRFIKNLYYPRKDDKTIYDFTYPRSVINDLFSWGDTIELGSFWALISNSISDVPMNSTKKYVECCVNNLSRAISKFPYNYHQRFMERKGIKLASNIIYTNKTN